MPVTVSLILVVLALLLTIGAGVGRVPLWVPVLLLCVAELVSALPR
jgi:hypothetical protein